MTINKPSKLDLEKDDAYFSADTVFCAKARLQQSLWRKRNGYKKGKLGNYIKIESDDNKRYNFLTERIYNLVNNEIEACKKTGKLIKQPRIWDNLLSSQPLCFNLFGELHFDTMLATRCFQRLFPDRISFVTRIIFEHSPGRDNLNFTGDKSAFDVFVEYTSTEKKKGCIGIEVKYAENMRPNRNDADASFLKNGKRYLELTEESQIFNKNEYNKLKTPRLQQVWRDHLLLFATKKEYDEGFFIFLYPEENIECKTILDDYTSCFTQQNESYNLFCQRTLETFVDAFKCEIKEPWINDFSKRYLFNIRSNNERLVS